ncbi:MAG: TetR/AcrR family transcriptional regulator [Spirochaetaceae bacterium]|nr:MAG: TetR/AcrR family transcriptional regulator [Spirochaetaceae bacterium]
MAAVRHPSESSDDAAHRRRDRAATEQRLVQATIDLIRDCGFDAAGVNAVAERAGVSKVLIYRYFGDYPGLLRAVANELKGFDPDLASGLMERLGADASPGSVLRNTVMALREMVTGDELMKGLLVWELSAQNELTAALCESREQIGLEQTRRFQQFLSEKRPDDPIDAHALLALVTAGVYYLTLRSDTAPVFNGIDIQSDVGWQRIADAVGDLMDRSPRSAD